MFFFECGELLSHCWGMSYSLEGVPSSAHSDIFFLEALFLLSPCQQLVPCEVMTVTDTKTGLYLLSVAVYCAGRELNPCRTLPLSSSPGYNESIYTQWPEER